MKRFLSLLAALVLLAGCAAAEPEAAQEPETAMEITGITLRGGHVTVRWKDPAGDGPYTLSYESARETTGQVRYRAGTTDEKQFTFDWLIPGENYTIRLWDASGHGISETFAVPEAAAYADGALTARGIRVAMQPRTMADASGDVTAAQDIRKLKAGDIEAGLAAGGPVYGWRYEIGYPALAHSRWYDTLVGIVSPGGFVDSYYMGKTQYPRFYNTRAALYWNFLGSDYFDSMYQTNGAVERGEYRVTLFWNGMKVNTASFTVE